MQKAKSYRNLIWGCCMTGIAMFFAFFFLYHTYIQDIIYEERLNQMEEITRQMFQNLEDVIDSHWDRVTEECNYLRDANIQTTDELCRHMKKKYELSAYADHKITLMAVDSEGDIIQNPEKGDFSGIWIILKKVLKRPVLFLIP